MMDTMYKHEPVKLEEFTVAAEVEEEEDEEELEEEDHKFSKCVVWRATTKTQATQTTPADIAEETKLATAASSASSNSSRTANLENEIESCGNVFILNRRKLFLICGFCERKYANMQQLSKHLNDCHSIFSTGYDDMKMHEGRISCISSGGGSGGVVSEAESDSDASAMTSGLILKGGFQIRFVREGSFPPGTENNPPTLPTPPPSIDDTLLKHVPIKVEDEVDDDVMVIDDSVANFDENIESCGNVYIMNRRKLFLICGFCESKYANLELLAGHLHDSHTIFQDDKEDEIPAEEAATPMDIAVKTEPEEPSFPSNGMMDDVAPPMVALPTGTSVDNEDIIPQEEVVTPMQSSITPAGVKERKVIPVPADDEVPAPTGPPPNEVPSEETTNLPATPSEVTPEEEVMKIAVAAAAAAAATEKKQLKEAKKQRRKRKPKTKKPELLCKKELKPSVFACKDCAKTFTKHSRLVEHIRLHTGEKPFKCGECGKSFRIKLRMTEHQLRHRTEKAFICEVCGLGLATRQDYSLHQRHHNGDKRYSCNECGKAFVRSSDLKTHLRIHSDERPFKCPICNLSFRANQNLIIHRRVHEGDKQFKCDYCDKRFLRKIDKRVHHRTHTGEKAFKCEICGRGYSAKVHVRRHIQKRHMEPLQNSSHAEDAKPKKQTKSAKDANKSFTCDFCPKLYSSSGTLRKHVARVHTNPSADSEDKKPTPCPPTLPTKIERLELPEASPQIVVSY